MGLLAFLFNEWTILIFALLFASYKYSVSTFDFFKKKNVPFAKPLPYFGNTFKMVSRQTSFFELVVEFCQQFKNEKLFGIFEIRNPLLVMNDPDIVRQVTVKHFDHFLNRRTIFSPEEEPLLGHSLSNLTDHKWKDMRSTLSPAFTGSKMRQMFELLEEVSTNAIGYLKEEAKRNDPLVIDMKDFCTRFTNDVIASAAFGLKVNSLHEKDNEFYQMGRKVTTFTLAVMIKMFFLSNFKSMMRFFKIRVCDEKSVNYYRTIVLNTIKYRMEHGIVRPDMINLLMEARRGALRHEDNETKQTESFAAVDETNLGVKSHNRNWTDDEVVANCFIFYSAGFENTSILMCFCAHELMENPEIQRKLIEEIDGVRGNLDRKPLTYEVLQRMKYLDMVISETLRKWPPFAGVDRICTKPFVFTDEDTGQSVPIDVGDVLWMPIAGFHYNEEFFPNPKQFDPERFSDENKSNIKPFTYIPFGAGPRNCIGSRFTLMEAKVIIYHLLSHFSFEVSSKNRLPTTLAGGTITPQPKGGFWLRLKPRIMRKLFGIFEIRNPLLVMNDPDVVRQVTVKHFDHFINHRTVISPEDDPLLGNSLFNLTNEKWKDMRSTLSPAFTGSKMRQMFELLEEVSTNAIGYLKEEAKRNDPLVIDMKNFCTRFTNDVIASAAFGLKVNSLHEKDNEFYQMGREATTFPVSIIIKMFLLSNFKPLMRLFKISLFDKKFMKYYKPIVMETIKYRMEHGIVRPDMINLLMEARRGAPRHEEDETKETESFAAVGEVNVGAKSFYRNWTDDEVVANCFLFFSAGFENTSILMCFCAHELMENPEVQKKLIQEIDEVRESLDGKPLTYEELQGMKYLDMVISETLRKWPPLVAVDRVCTKPFVFTDENTGQSVPIDVGDVLWMPIVGFHYNEEFFPNPKQFDPERFSDENKSNIKPFTYIPFGAGPRNCIGSRFTLMEAKVIIYHLLSHFSFEVSDKTQLPLRIAPGTITLQPKGGFWLHLKPRQF